MSKKLVYLISLVLVLSLAGEGWPYASRPNPPDGATHEDTWVDLRWQPGDHAVSHDIYFGENYENVKHGTGDTFQGNQSTAFFVIGFPGFPYPDGLVPGTTYYWRIDEINDQHPDSPWVGDVWSFMIPPSTAYNPEPADGAEFIDPNEILSWEPGFRAKLHTVYFGDNFAEVSNATGGVPRGIPTYTPGLLEIDKTYYWRVDEFDGIATHKGDVWSFTVGAEVPPNETDRAGNVIYVDVDAVSKFDGSSWAYGYRCLQDAIAQAQLGDEIRVAKGVYKPDRRIEVSGRAGAQVTASGDWTATFELIEGVTKKGGYAGYGESNPDARDIELYETVLSGDLYGNDIDVNNPWDMWEATSRSENSYHVLTTRSTVEDAVAVLDGFTITGGNANESSYYNGNGGGLYNPHCTIRITNCTFTRNSALLDGGGIYSNQGDLSLTNCKFTENLAGSGGGAGVYNYRSSLRQNNCAFIRNLSQYGEGGGINNDECDPNLTNCIFIENSARSGGGIYNRYSSPTLTNCVFTGNSVRGQGGGVYNFNRNMSRPILRNCLFTANSAGNSGGGIYNYWGVPVLTNCTFAWNSADNGNALACRSDNERNIVTLTNCILWDGGNEIWNNDNSIIHVSYSNIQGGWPGTGNIDANPLFADSDGPDNIPGTLDDDLQLTPISPCIDAGDPEYAPEPGKKDIGGNLRIVSGRVDMGAYEFPGIIYVDNYGLNEPGQIDPIENGSEAHPSHTIQKAIDIAKDRQTVLVRPGVYYKIDFKGKAITVAGTEGAAVIEALTGSSRAVKKEDAVTFHTGEGPDSVLKNFIIRNSGMAISLNYDSSPTITNLTIADNDFGIAAYENSNPDISNCIFWNNRDGDLFQCNLRYSCLEGEAPGEGNISGDPLFADPANGDYHLKSEGWRWNMNSGTWTYDNITSRCIDAGDPASPLSDEPMSVPRDPNNEYGINQRINMGAYSGTCQASIPPLGWLEELSTE